MLEETFWSRGLRVAGVDEAGRGALAGPLVAAAVVLPPGRHPYRDSKKLSARQRELLLDRLLATALAWGVGVSSATEVDRLGVLRATHRAAGRALARLRVAPDALVTDYLFLETDRPLLAPARAEEQSPSVAAASILAKVVRDRIMLGLHRRYPDYGFAGHKGYGTREHLERLARLGPCPQHRRRFAPVAQAGLWDGT
ncbi:MAG TPA: ribonuclease HII [Oceanithermus profundus]|uniref:Ribonuclease HII n=1 Tax=Oceanithermus profundus TaxID=187137 RepID=A0A7C4V4V2_9DEIN|nr:ribonuclease HII [Oceanithermus profundus]